ncbi:hypothetical protein B7494_g2170 [Chlorociboria aeruginascens]|nr:hypothetical protein B7494_g2170 [Chlorociboria aeruginascens]
MASSVPSSSSEANYSSSDSDVESSTTNYAQSDAHSIDDTPYHRDGELTGQDGTDMEIADGKVQSEDTVLITATGGKAPYSIFSLAPTGSGSAKREAPFALRITPATSLPREYLDKYLFRGLPTYLSPVDHEIHILISTLSGTGLAPEFFDEVLLRLLKAVGLEDKSYNVVRTNSADSVKEFAQSVLLARANEAKKQTVLMLSGDGGMVDTINGLLETKSRSYTKPILSQLPLGTGNALFHSLHRSSTTLSIYIQGLLTLLHGTPQPLPIFRTTFSPGSRLITNEGQTATPLTNNTLYGAVVASYGLHATLVADSDTVEYRKHGDERFKLVAKELLSPEDGGPPHAYQATVLLTEGGKEQEVKRKEHGYVLATLVSNLEKTFTISPHSTPLDGQIRVVHFGATTGEQTMQIMRGAYDSGSHIGMEWEDGREKVGYNTVDKLRIKFLEEGEGWKWRRCCVDGLIVGVEQGGFMEIENVEGGAEAVDVVFDKY